LQKRKVLDWLESITIIAGCMENRTRFELIQ